MSTIIKFRLGCILCVLLLVFVAGLISAQDDVPTDKIFLNCGGPSVDSDGRKWTSDIGSKFVLSGGKSFSSQAAAQKPSVPDTPYMTARVFQSKFTYSFLVASGRKFIRLYFYPASYADLNALNAAFSVTAGPYSLLKNFSAFQNTAALNCDYMFKEYSVNVPSTTLNITFSPVATRNSYAFVNGIEIVSHPDIYNSEAGTTMIVGQTVAFTIYNSTTLENVYRLNFGGNVISPSQDTGLFRSWNDDSVYIFGVASGVTETTDPNMIISYPTGMPTYVAPLDVYRTARSMGPDPNINSQYNLTWIFSVDSGFSYLVRLHFCEVSDIITKINQRVFDIFLYNQTADSGADVIAYTKSNGVPLYRDYVVVVPSGPPQQDLWLALHPHVAAPVL